VKDGVSLMLLAIKLGVWARLTSHVRLAIDWWTIIYCWLMHRLSLVRELLSFPTDIKTAEKFGVRLNDIGYFYLSSVFTTLLPDATFFLLGIRNLVFGSFQLFHPRSFPLSSAVPPKNSFLDWKSAVQLAAKLWRELLTKNFALIAEDLVVLVVSVVLNDTPIIAGIILVSRL
jgi:hypothetical protein